jgi:hypothetical protein
VPDNGWITVQPEFMSWLVKRLPVASWALVLVAGMGGARFRSRKDSRRASTGITIRTVSVIRGLVR